MCKCVFCLECGNFESKKLKTVQGFEKTQIVLAKDGLDLIFCLNKTKEEGLDLIV